MLKALVLMEAASSKALLNKLQQLPGVSIVAIITPSEYSSGVQQMYKADIVITNNIALNDLLHGKDKNAPRQQVKAITHQGIRLVQVENIYYFQAEHKYVTAFHTRGQLLIEDTLNSLEQEFGDVFVRIHRKTLVAMSKIENLFKNEAGQYCIKLRDRDEILPVSRRQLPFVRKALLWI